MKVTAYEKNKPAFDWLGITQWHKAGYKGQGIKIMIIDLDTEHGLMTKSIVEQILPEAHIEYITNPYGLVTHIQRAITDKYNVVTVSLKYHHVPISATLSQRAVDAGVMLCAAAGNDGKIPKHSIGFPAKKATWVSVGAAYVNQMNRKVERALYSSTGDELEVMGYTGRWVDFNGRQKQYTGTSGACPVFASMMGLVKQRWPEMTAQHKRDMIKLHTVDMDMPGRDSRTGWGMFRLPNVVTGERSKEIIMKIDDSTMVVDGERKPMDTEPIIHKNRTMVPVSFVAEELGAEVQWNPSTREVTIRR